MTYVWPWLLDFWQQQLEDGSRCSWDMGLDGRLRLHVLTALRCSALHEV